MTFVIDCERKHTLGILLHLYYEAEANCMDISRSVETPYTTARNTLREMKKQGLVESTCVRNGLHTSEVYKLMDKGRMIAEHLKAIQKLEADRA